MQDEGLEPSQVLVSYSGLILVVVMIVAMVLPLLQFFVTFEKTDAVQQRVAEHVKSSLSSRSENGSTTTVARDKRRFIQSDKSESEPMPNDETAVDSTKDMAGETESQFSSFLPAEEDKSPVFTVSASSNENDSRNSSENNNISSSNWRCACEGGFLPPGMLQSLGGMEAVMRMGTGQCYHKT